MVSHSVSGMQQNNIKQSKLIQAPLPYTNLRHILEDPSAPFKVCSFVAAPGQSKCTNVISVAHPKG